MNIQKVFWVFQNLSQWIRHLHDLVEICINLDELEFLLLRLQIDTDFSALSSVVLAHKTVVSTFMCSTMT